MIEAGEITIWEEYRDASRRGRGTPLTAVQRKQVWDAVVSLRERAAAAKETTWAGRCAHAATLLQAGRIVSPYDAVIVDEMQDLDAGAVRFVAALAGAGPDALLLVGDAGQRLYGRPVSLRACGVEVRGRSHVLRVNYRTTHQIRRFADAALGDVPDEDTPCRWHVMCVISHTSSRAAMTEE